MEREQDAKQDLKTLWMYRVKRYGARVAFCVFALWVLTSFIVQAGALSGQARELKELEDQIALEKRTQSDLNARIEYQQSDEFIERYARDNLGYLMPGEIRFVDVTGQ